MTHNKGALDMAELGPETLRTLLHSITFADSPSRELGDSHADAWNQQVAALQEHIGVAVPWIQKIHQAAADVCQAGDEDRDMELVAVTILDWAERARHGLLGTKSCN